jgi:hypothetical protein
VRLGAVTPHVNGAADAGPASTPYKAAPFLQMGPCNWLISVADASFGRSDRIPNFGLASLGLQDDKSQGRQGSGASARHGTLARRTGTLDRLGCEESSTRNADCSGVA